MSLMASSKISRCLLATAVMPLAIACQERPMASMFFWWCSMILVTSNDGTLSCSPSFWNVSVKFCGASAIRTSSSRLQGELQPLLQRVQGQTGQPADQGSVEADVLQVAANGELDAADQHVDVPGFHLVGD